MCQGMFTLDVRRLFMERVVGNCKDLSRERVMTPSPSEFKKYLHNAHNHTVYFLVVPCGTGSCILMGPFQLEVVLQF